MEIVGMRGAEAGYRFLCLRPGGCILRVGVRDPTNVWILTIKFQVSGQIRGRPQFALDYFAFQIGDDHVIGGQIFVGYAAGFDRHQTTGAIDAAGIAKGVKHKSAANELKIRFEYVFAQFWQEHDPFPIHSGKRFLHERHLTELALACQKAYLRTCRRGLRCLARLSREVF